MLPAKGTLEKRFAVFLSRLALSRSPVILGLGSRRWSGGLAGAGIGALSTPQQQRARSRRSLKQAMTRRRTPRDKTALKSSLTSYTRSLQRHPAKVRAFFQALTVRYAS